MARQSTDHVPRMQVRPVAAAFRLPPPHAVPVRESDRRGVGADRNAEGPRMRAELHRCICRQTIRPTGTHEGRA